MKDKVVSLLAITGLKEEEIVSLVEVPKDSKLGDYAFPCFALAKTMKKSPVEIAKTLVSQIKNIKEFEKIEAIGPYINFFVNRNQLVEETLKEIQKKKDKYGSSLEGKGKKIVIELSSPNIAKPFGIGHLRSTIIGNSISKISEFLGYKTTKINYLGDWGTPFGKIIAGYEEFGNKDKLKEDPIKHLYEIYVKVSKDEDFEQKGRDIFKKLESGDKKYLALWKKFRELSITEFNKIYSDLNVKFDVISGESFYEKPMKSVIKELEGKNLLKESEGAIIVDLSEYNLPPCLVKKSDGSTLYATRDLAAAIERYKKYKFDKMVYEVGAEQSLHFTQIFKVLELMGYDFSKNCMHVKHGLYLDSDGKKFATRKGKTVFMEEILQETKELAKEEIAKREKLSSKELEERAKKIALSAIIYGDLKNYREGNIVFDIERFVSFEGDTGPYLLYTYARAKSILRKSNQKKSKLKIKAISDKEKTLVNHLSSFHSVVKHAYDNMSPNIIANYALELSQLFNEFYHSTQVIGSESESFRLAIVDASSQVLKNALNLLGIDVIEKM